MSATDTFRRQHAELFELAKELGASLGSAPGALRAQDALHAMARLAGKLRVHAAMEEEALYPRLFAHDDATVRETARAFAAKFGDVYKAFLDFRAAWTADAIAASPDEFVRGARGAIGLLGERVTHENAELYGMVDRLYPSE